MRENKSQHSKALFLLHWKTFNILSLAVNYCYGYIASKKSSKPYETKRSWILTLIEVQNKVSKAINTKNSKRIKQKLAISISGNILRDCLRGPHSTWLDKKNSPQSVKGASLGYHLGVVCLGQLPQNLLHVRLFFMSCISEQLHKPLVIHCNIKTGPNKRV